MESGRKIKILHVIDSLGVGGTERIVIDVVNGLDPATFDHTVCCVSREGESAKFLREGARCIDLNKGRNADHLMSLKIARVIREESPDIIHTRSWAGVDGVAAKMIARKPSLVHSEHGRNLPYIDHEPLRRKIVRRFVYHLADVVFTVSDEIRRYFCNETGFPVERMRVIPNGIDIGRFDKTTANGARHELGILAEDIVIGTVARLDANKDIATLIRAFAHLSRAKKELSLKLLVVGDGAEKPRLESLAAEQQLADRVIFTGLRHDVPSLLRMMRVFALPSLSEGLPGAVLEAMCASLPVVATDVGTLKDLITEGENGFLVSPGKPEMMAESLGRFVEEAELARRLGAEGRRKVERLYSLETMLRRYGDLYSSLYNQRGRD